MRHRKISKRLSKQKRKKQPELRNQAVSLILHEKIKTTKTKAALLRSVIEKLITIAKKQDLTARRKLISYLPKMGAVRKLIDEIGPRYMERAGGYTRIRKIGVRKGDSAEMAQIEFIS